MVRSAGGSQESGHSYPAEARSRKNLGGGSGANTQCVLNLTPGTARTLQRPRQLVNLGHTVLREMNQLCVPVGREVHPPQVMGHHVGENPLVVADDDQFAGRFPFRGAVGVLSAVIQDLRSIGKQALAGEGGLVIIGLLPRLARSGLAIQ
jgi:hypothetical protein